MTLQLPVPPFLAAARALRIAADDTRSLDAFLARSPLMSCDLKLESTDGKPYRAKAMAAFCKRVLVGPGSGLRSLSFVNCRFYPAAFQRLAKAIAKCRTLEHLAFEGCDLNERALTALCGRLSSLSSRSRLASLEIDGFTTTPRVVDAFAKLIETHRCLRRLSLCHAAIDDASSSSLCAALRRTGTRVALELSHCRFGDVGWKALVEAGATLRRLDGARCAGNAETSDTPHGPQASAEAAESAEAIDAWACEWSWPSLPRRKCWRSPKRRH